MKGFWQGFVLASALWGCAAATTIPWPYYGLQAAHYDGNLLAVDPKNDLDMALCAPKPGKPGQCIVMFGADFYAFKADDLRCHSDLVACQHGFTARR